MEPVPEPLRLYGRVNDCHPPEWAWVDRELERAGTYWIGSRGHRHPHLRPVWGVWNDRTLFLSIGSPTIARELEEDPTITVHLESGTDVVIVEGHASGTCVEPRILERYDAKYDWNYTIDEYGPLTLVVPSVVIAWRSADWAGRGGFRSAGRFRLT